MKACKQCGHEFKSQNGSFCSRKCFAESMKVYHTCIVCNNKFTRSLRGRPIPKFCSKKCFHEHNVSSNNPNYKGALLKGVCKTCGVSFEYYKSSSIGMYCSNKCTNANKDWRYKQSIAKIKTFSGEADSVIKARIRASKRYSQWCYQIYLRDGFKCVECSSKNKIQAHHKIAFSAIYNEIKLKDFANIDAIYDIDNGITLCEQCHKQTDSYYSGIAKIPETRLLNVINLNFERDTQGFKSFAAYYENEMELLINHYKTISA